MKTHYCKADKAVISYEGECNWCGEKENEIMFSKPDGAGKGDAPRPTDWDKFSKNFDEIFGTKKQKPEEKPTDTGNK